nr:uncharacterized protein LOC128692952 isoform X1 [Cherax quadricarinatus]
MLFLEGKKCSLPPVEDSQVTMQDQYLRDVIESVLKEHEEMKAQEQEIRVQDRLGKFADTCTAHGIYGAYWSRGWFRRTVWILVLAVMVGYGTYQCYNIIAEYLTYPKKVTIGVEEERTVLFPAVTLCNLNPLPRKDKLHDHPVYGAFVQVEDEMEKIFTCNYQDYVPPELQDSNMQGGSPDDSSTFSSDETSAVTAAYMTTKAVGGNASASRKIRAAPDVVVPAGDQMFGPTDNPPVDNRTQTLTLHREAENPEIINEGKPSKEERSGRKEDSKLGNKKEIKLDTTPEDILRRLKRQAANVTNAIPKKTFKNTTLGIQFTYDFENFTKANLDKLLNPPKENETQARKIRSNCSNGYYTYLEFINKKATSDDTPSTFGTSNNEHCPTANYTLDISYNVICQLVVFCDNFGCFDYKLQEFKATNITDTYNLTKRNCNSTEVHDCNILYCFSCANDTCLPLTFLSSLGDAYVREEEITQVFNNSHTPDFSDVMEMYAPNSEDLDNYSVPVNESINTCTRDRRACSYRDFYVWNSDSYGKCYTYNSAFLKIKVENNREVNAAPVNTSLVGPNYGLRLTINIHQSNYLALLSQDIGLRVIVHSPYQLPFPEDEGFNISPGVSVSARITRRKLIRVGKPHGNCRSDTDSQIFTEYSAVRCKRMCIEQAYWQRCYCYAGKSPAYDSRLPKPQTPCDIANVSHQLCMEMVRFNYQQQNLICDCPPACSETIYDSQVTLSEENKPFYVIIQNLVKRKLADDLCGGNSSDAVRIHLYLDSLNYEIIQESPAYTWDTLVSNVGGNLGLFIGMSLMTVVELMEFLVDVILIYFKSRQKVKPNSQMRIVTPIQNKE